MSMAGQDINHLSSKVCFQTVPAPYKPLFKFLLFRKPTATEQWQLIPAKTGTGTAIDIDDEYRYIITRYC